MKITQRTYKYLTGLFVGLFLMIASEKTSGQSFPVTINVQVLGQDLPYLEQFLSTNPQALQAIINLNDPTRPEYDVYLKLELSGAGVSLRSRADYAGNIFTLSFGQPLILNGFDLRDHFLPENLDFSGIDQAAFFQDGRLPEGIYNLCIEAYDVNRPELIPVSNRGCGIGVIQIHDVPVIVAPVSPHIASNPQNIVFQWIPQHVGSFSVEYDLVIFEAIPGYSEDQIIRTGEVSYVEGITVPQYVYSFSDPWLYPDNEYLVYLRVRDPTGMRVFKNGGVSQVHRFRILRECISGDECDDGDPCTIDDRYNSNCDCTGVSGPDFNGNGIADVCEEGIDIYSPTGMTAPIALPAKKLDKEIFLAVWTTVENADHYLVEISDDLNFNHIHTEYSGIEISDTSMEISGLSLENYQYYRVRAVGKDTISFYSNAVAVTDKEGCIPVTQEGLDCDESLEELGHMSSVLIDNLDQGDQIFAGDYAVTIRRLSGNGRYSGSGFIQLPYTDQGRLNVRFSNISVNENCQLIDGFLEVTGIGVEILDESIGDFFDEVVDKLDELDFEIETTDRIIKEVSVLLNDTEGVNDYFSGGIDIARGGRALREEYSFLSDSLIQQFNQAIDCIGRAIEAGGSPEMCREQWQESLEDIITAIKAEFDSEGQVLFYNGNIAQFAYDSIDYARPSLEKIYQEITVAGKPYPVHWKMIESGHNDYIMADPGLYSSGEITFVYNDGTPVEISENTGQKQHLRISGGLNTRRQLYALDGNQKYAGKLNILSYNRKKIPLKIIPINSVESYPYELNTLAGRLEQIFDPALVDVDVEVLPVMRLEWFDGVLSGSPGNLLENYNDEMDRINRTVDNKEGFYYLFLIPDHEDATIQGYWPRGRQWGYLIDDAHQNHVEYERTIAHELAHGALRLAHIYEECNAPIGSTDNLMDHGEGDRIYGYQWDQIHNPVYEIAELEEETEGRSVVSLQVDDLNSNLWIDYDYGNETEISFLTPAGQRLILPTVNGEKRAKYGIKTKEGGIYKPGVLSRFQLYNSNSENWDTYSAWYVNSKPAVFYGYARRKWDEEDQKYVPDLPWYRGVEGSDNEVWVTGVKNEECEFRVVTNSGPVTGIMGHEEAVIIPDDIDLSDFDKTLETMELTEEECKELDQIFIFNYSSQNLDTALLNDLYAGYNPIDDPVAGERHNTRIRLFFTDETTGDANMEKLTALKNAFSKEVLWIHMENGRYYYRSKYGPIENLWQYYEDQRISMEEFMGFVQGFPNELVIAVYEIADFAANGIRTLRIPAYVWDCGSEHYDARYAKIYGYVTMPLAAQRELLENSISAVWEVDLPGSEVELAFICGIWNGMTEVVASVPELVRLVGLFDAERRAEFLDQIQALWNYKRYDEEKQDTVRGVARAFIDLFDQEFDRNNACKFAHSTSEYGLSIVLAFVNPSGTGSRAISTASRFLTLLKAMDDLAGHLLSMGLKVRYVAKGVEIVSAAGNDVLMTIRDGVFRANVIIAGRIDELIADFSRMDMADALVQTEDGLILRYNDREYPLVGRSNKDFIASNIGIPVELLDGFRAMGLRDVEIRDLVAAYLKSDFSPRQIYDYVEGNVATAKDVFLRDLTKSTDFGEWVLGDEGRVRVWEDFEGAGKDYAKRNVAMLTKYNRLAENIKPLILQFSDGKNNSTLSRFLGECDEEFLSFINQTENENIVKSFVSHKEGIDLSDISDGLADKLIDDIDDIPGEIGEKVRIWNKRSANISTNQNKFARARQFELSNSNRIKNNLDPPCGAWGGNEGKYILEQLHVRAKGSSKRVVLDDAIIDIKVYTDPVTLQEYNRLIYHDSKLTTDAPWSNNQYEEIIKIFKDNRNKNYIEFEVRSSDDYFALYPGSPIGNVSKVRIFREDIYKSISNGLDDSILEVINLNNINFIDQ